MNGFRKLQERLAKEGWYVGWNHYCCQTCAWDDVPDKHEEGPFEGEEVDLSKVLFNHSQDCEYYDEDEEECELCEGDGFTDEGDDCPECNGTGMGYSNLNTSEFDTSAPGFVCNFPEQQGDSLFCFDGSKEGVENLKAILPIIEECGCKYWWDETGETRIEISWDLK